MNNASFHNLRNMFFHMCSVNLDFRDWIVETYPDGNEIICSDYVSADTMKKILKAYGIKSWNVPHDIYENLFRPERRTESILKVADWMKELEKYGICTVWENNNTVFFSKDKYYFTIQAEKEIIIRCFISFNDDLDCPEDCVAIGIVTDFQDILHFIEK